jgi:flavodoxin I
VDIAAIFGRGDQNSYEEYFVDGIDILATQFEKARWLIVDKCPLSGYEFEISKARIDKNTFYGIPID